MTYASGTVLLIAFDDMKLYSGYRKSLLQVINKEGGLTGSQFAEVYLINTETNELRRVA